MSDILICNTSFTAEVNGDLVTVRKGASVRAGHPLIASRQEFFNAPAVDFDYDPSDSSTEDSSPAVDESSTGADGEVAAESEPEPQPEPAEAKPKATRSRRRIG